MEQKNNSISTHIATHLDESNGTSRKDRIKMKAEMRKIKNSM
jgi:hypothetical protein